MHVPGDIPEGRINFTTSDAYSEPVQVRRSITLLSVQVVLKSGQSWSSAVASLQYTLHLGEDADNNSLEDWTAFSPAVTLTASTKSQLNVPVTGKGYIRLATTTAAAEADDAIIVWRLQ